MPLGRTPCFTAGSPGSKGRSCAGTDIADNRAATHANNCLYLVFIIFRILKCKIKTKNSYFCISCDLMDINVKQIEYYYEENHPHIEMIKKL